MQTVAQQRASSGTVYSLNTPDETPAIQSGDTRGPAGRHIPPVSSQQSREIRARPFRLEDTSTFWDSQSPETALSCLLISQRDARLDARSSPRRNQRRGAARHQQTQYSSHYRNGVAGRESIQYSVRQPHD